MPDVSIDFGEFNPVLVMGLLAWTTEEAQFNLFCA
jgi:hypothetical protein